jgi:hypothetical protein
MGSCGKLCRVCLLVLAIPGSAITAGELAHASARFSCICPSILRVQMTW